PETGKEVRQLAPKRFYFALAWSPDGRTLAAASADMTIRLWETVTGSQLRQLIGHTDGVCSVAWSPDGKTLASGSWDATVLVWDIANAGFSDKPQLSLDLAALWDDLAADAPKAYEAIRALIAAPPQTVPFLRQRLQADAGLDARQV